MKILKHKFFPRRRPMRMRLRIARGIFFLLLALCSGIWITVAQRSMRFFNASLDESLKANAELASRNALLEQEEKAEQVTEDEVKAIPSWWPAGATDAFYEIRVKGNLIAHSPALAPGNNLTKGINLKKMVHDKSGWNLRIGNQKLRCFAEEFRIPAKVFANSADSTRTQKVTMIVAMERKQADRRFYEIVTRSGMALLCALIMAVAGTWAIVAWGTRPLALLARDVTGLKPDSIQPVRIPSDPDLALLASQLNLSLDVMSKSYQREKRFSSDVAHELLTPLGGLRTELDVALLKPRAPEELILSIRHCAAMVGELQNVVESLLELGRLESGSRGREHEEVELQMMADIAWGGAADIAASKNLGFQNKIPSDARVMANISLLDIILRNLFSNAIRYSKPGGEVIVETLEEANSIVLRVANEARNIPEGFKEHAFERFWRGDGSRSHTAGREGIGLGLALAQSAARAMDSKIDLEIDGQKVIFALKLKATNPS